MSGDWKPAPDQRCCGTCRLLEVLPTDDGWGPALQCRNPERPRESSYIGGRWWGGACVWWSSGQSERARSAQEGTPT